MILHKARKRLYSEEKWMRYITKKSVKDYNNPVSIEQQKTILHEQVRRQLETERAAPLKRTSRLKSERRAPEVHYCVPCEKHYVKRDMKHHVHTVGLSRMGHVGVTG